jgi:catechol 2,3-dioxygenase-like lactoylglutathione lyase family enzyme
MSARLFRVIIPVTGIDRAAAFYSSLLQMPGERVSPGRHYFDCGGTILACFDPGADGDPFELPPNPEHVYLAVDGLEAALERARSASAGSLSRDGEPEAMRIAVRPWGERSFYCTDPFGNPLCFVERGTEFTGGDSPQRPQG